MKEREAHSGAHCCARGRRKKAQGQRAHYWAPGQGPAHLHGLCSVQVRSSCSGVRVQGGGAGKGGVAAREASGLCLLGEGGGEGGGAGSGRGSSSSSSSRGRGSCSCGGGSGGGRHRRPSGCSCSCSHCSAPSCAPASTPCHCCCSAQRCCRGGRGGSCSCCRGCRLAVLQRHAALHYGTPLQQRQAALALPLHLLHPLTLHPRNLLALRVWGRAEEQARVVGEEKHAAHAPLARRGVGQHGQAL